MRTPSDTRPHQAPRRDMYMRNLGDGAINRVADQASKELWRRTANLSYLQRDPQQEEHGQPELCTLSFTHTVKSRRKMGP